MKLGTILRDGEPHLVVRVGDRAVDVTRAARSRRWASEGLPLSLGRLVEAFASDDPAPRRAVERLARVAQAGDHDELLEADSPDLEWLPPLRPPKIIAVGLNYWDHCREQRVQPPQRPVLFGKWANALNAHRRPIAMAEGSERLDFEAELGVIVGKRARRLSEAAALSCVFGYVAFNDVTARDFQKGDGQWMRGKSQDTFAPFGPWVATADEIPDPQRLRITARLNGVTVQDSSTAEMIFPVARLLAFVSAGITLTPGDLLATGTPAGVGVYRDPPRFLEPGDVVEVEVEGIGRLVNRVVAAGEAGALEIPSPWPL